jgi:hypothetical protein
MRYRQVCANSSPRREISPSDREHFAVGGQWSVQMRQGLADSNKELKRIPQNNLRQQVWQAPLSV